MNRRILLLELNEVTWDLIDPLIAAGKLPNFARMKKEGTWGAPVSVDLPPQLDPWVTWNTLYTGRTQHEHNVFFLQQPPESIKAKRIWEICAEQGLRVGVYGSLCSWPPKKVDGYCIPDTFAKDASTYPEQLRSIQVLNLTYTRSIRVQSEGDTLGFKMRLGARLFKLGLRVSAASRIIGQLFRERFSPSLRWRRAALQPLVNFQFFRRLYRRYRPHFATFHTNHVAHYQHTYWKAMDPTKFLPQDTTEEERRTYGQAIEYGYVIADALLGKVSRLLDSETVLVVASSMGQKPFLTTLKSGKLITQVRSLPKLLEILGLAGQAEALSTMSNEFNIYIDNEGLRKTALETIQTTYIDVPERLLFVVEVLDNAIRCNLRTYEKDLTPPNARIHFPLAPGSPTFSYEDLIYDTGHAKSGCHDPHGMVIFYGAGIRPGLKLREYNNLDFAPTFLRVLGLPAQPEMLGRVMEEVL
jgi:hypothetical protein